MSRRSCSTSPSVHCTSIASTEFVQGVHKRDCKDCGRTSIFFATNYNAQMLGKHPIDSISSIRTDTRVSPAFRIEHFTNQVFFFAICVCVSRFSVIPVLIVHYDAHVHDHALSVGRWGTYNQVAIVIAEKALLSVYILRRITLISKKQSFTRFCPVCWSFL